MYRITTFCIARPSAALFLIVLITIGFASGFPKLRTEFGFRVLIGNEHLSIKALDEFILNFGGGLPVQIAWECGGSSPCKSVFDRASLSMADEITKKLQMADGVTSVWGPANAPVFVSSEYGFDVRTLVENGAPGDAPNDLIARVYDDSLWVNHFISSDGLIGVIVVQPTDTRSETDTKVVSAIEDATRRFKEQGFAFYLVGASSGSVLAGQDLTASMMRVVPALVFVVAIALLLLTRSIRHTIVALVSTGTGVFWTFGLMGWLGWPRDGIHEILAPFILVVGICDALHFLSRYSAEKKHRTSNDAMVTAACDVGMPCVITSLTTGGALVSFTTSSLDTFVRFGLASAFGVMVCLLLTFSLLPVLMQLSQGFEQEHGDSKVSNNWNAVIEATIRVNEKRFGTILGAAIVVLLFFGAGWYYHLQVNMDWYESFGENSYPMQSTRFLQKHFEKSETLEIQLSLPEDVELGSPTALHSISTLSHALTEIDGLGGVTSVVDLISRVNRLVHDDDEQFERVGDSLEENSEIIELIAFESGSSLSNWVSLNRKEVRISVETKELSHLDVGDLLSRVRSIIKAELLPGWNVMLSGETAINYDWVRDVQETQISSFVSAFFIVFVLVVLFFRSFSLAAAAMVPTLLPVVVTLGAMGWMGLSLDVGRAMIATILIGIGVDDAIHVLNHYRIRRSAGDDRSKATGEALRHGGRAVMTTSCVLSLGFLTLMASKWQTISGFGLFASLAIMGALVASLFVLPSLILLMARISKGSIQS